MSWHIWPASEQLRPDVGRVICSPGCASHEVREALGQGPRAATQPSRCQQHAPATSPAAVAGQPAAHPQPEAAGAGRPLRPAALRCAWVGFVLGGTLTERERHRPLSNRAVCILALHLFTKLDQAWGVLGMKDQRGGLQGGRGRREAPAGASRRRTPSPPLLPACTLPSSSGLLLLVANITAEIHLPFKSQHLIIASEPFSFLLPSKTKFQPWSSR